MLTDLTQSLKEMQNKVNRLAAETDALRSSSLGGLKRPIELSDDEEEDDDNNDNEEKENAVPHWARFGMFAPTDNYKWNCNQIRTKINAYLRSGEMKVTEFQRTIGTNSNSYGRFMRQSGPNAGSNSNVYDGAHDFFEKREAQGLKMPRAKKAKTTAADNSTKYDVSDIKLDDEETDEVEIYDTCDDIRRKINAHLRNSGMTNAAFCRAISDMFVAEPRKIQSVQLSSFLKKKGALDGNSSGVYYGAYVYFEKLRIKQKGKKSEKRLELEHLWPSGIDTKILNNRVWICSATTRGVAVDQYGKVYTY